MLATVYEREVPKGQSEEARLRARMEVYYDRLKILPAEEWEASVRRCLDVCRFFPNPAELLQAYNEILQRQRGGPEAEALAAFELVAQSTTHALLHVSPQTFRCWRCRPCEQDAADPGCQNCGGRGTVRRKVAQGCGCSENKWDQRLIRERLGRAAAEGFVAAGGEGAFANLSESDPFVRKRFSEAYLSALSAQREAGVPLPMLEEGRATSALPGKVEEIGRETASGLLRLVAGKKA
jgi:hypothetical protein